MAKPVTLPRWATDLTNNDAPTSGQMNTGWTPGQTGVSDYDNYIKYWTYKWCEWLDVGAMEFVTLHVTGASDLDGAVNIDSTLHTDGAIDTDSTVTATNFKHTTALQLPIPAMLSDNDGGSHLRLSSNRGWTLIASASKIIIPIMLPIGMRITAWEVYVDKQTSSANTMYAQVFRCHADGTESSIGALVSNNQNSPGSTLIPQTENIDIAANYQYYLKFTPTGAANDFLYHTLVYYTRP